VLTITRPPASPDTKPVHTFRASHPERVQFNALAEKLGLSFSETCRVALLALIANETKITA
jgi:hypothetical protein